MLAWQALLLRPLPSPQVVFTPLFSVFERGQPHKQRSTGDHLIAVILFIQSFVLFCFFFFRKTLITDLK